MEKKQTYRRLLSYLKPYRKQIAIAYIGMLFGTISKLIIPRVVAWAIDNGLTAGNGSALYRAGGIIMVLALISGTVSFLYFYYGHWLSHRVAYDLRNDLYRSVQFLPFSFHDRAKTGDLMSRATSDITETEWFVGIRLAELVSIILTVSGTIIAMLATDVRLALIGLAPIPVLVFATVRFGSIVRPLFKKIQEQLSEVSSTMQESITGIRVVKAFAREPFELKKFDLTNENWYEGRVGLITKWANNWPFFTFLVSVCIFLLLLAGGPMAIRQEVTIGELTALISYVLMLQAPIQGLGFIVNLAATAGSAAGRVFEIMDEQNEIEDRPNALPLSHVTGAVSFQNVTFGYREGQTILRDVTFEVEPGEKIALVGPTGSGKSTITNLLPRFYEQQTGQILVDGHDIRDVTLNSLRSNIGAVLQDSFLFSSSIADNIAYGRRTATRQDIVEAAKAAQAHDFIMRFPNGYDTMVGERGVTLSGGQKQRVAIARTLLIDPAILILDDATSSVDNETEHLISLALQKLMQGRTTFIIAQRLLTVKNADKILVLDDGAIVERGRHDELLAGNGLYREIYDLQLKDMDELASSVA